MPAAAAVTGFGVMLVTTWNPGWAIAAGGAAGASVKFFMDDDPKGPQGPHAVG